MPSKARALRPTIPVVHRSASLERDHAAPEGRGQQFILTGCARQAIWRIVKGISGPNSPRAWTLTGPFGTGKSSFCLFLSRLLAPASLGGANEARRMLHESDASLAEVVRASEIGPRGLVPVVITASRESGPVALARGLVAALRVGRSRKAKRLAKEIEESAKGGKTDALWMVERAVDCLVSEEEAVGVMLIIDELGKLLEDASSHPFESDVYLLQRLAEYATRSQPPFLVIGVLHQDFSGYARDLAQSDRQEWEKVRGRFEDIIFEQSAADMLRLIGEAMAVRSPRTRPEQAAARDSFEALCDDAWTAKVVPPGLDRGAGHRLLSACFPLHPCVSLLLGPVFKRFGQHERSAFSFLTSGESFALPDFVSRFPMGTLYNIAHLYEYLVGVLGDSLLRSKDGKRWAEAFNVEAQHSDLSQGEVNVLHAIALLGIVGRWNGVAPTPEVVRYSLAPSMTRGDVDEGIGSLLARASVVYRKFNDTYNLWEGSDIDVEALIADARARIAMDASSVELLRSHFSLRPLVARRHSFESGTLRFFDVVFASPSRLGDVVSSFEAAAEQSKADGQIVVLLPEADFSGGISGADELLGRVTSRPEIILCLPGNARELESLARDLAAIRWARSSTPELQHDATARRELATRESDVWRHLEQAMTQVMAPARGGLPRTQWYRLGAKQKLETQRALNELLSAVCDELFSCSPEIQNEIINRWELSSSAAAAQGKLIGRMVQHGDKEGLGIEGYPPERSIYLSVLRALNLHQEHQGRWSFVASENLIREDAQPVYKAIKEFFVSAEREHRGIDQLFRLLRRPPYGLRDGVVPILVCAALLANDADVAVYENGAFVPQLSDAIFEKLLKEPAQYSVRQWKVKGVRIAVLQQLGRMLGRSVGGSVEPRDLLDVVKPLVRFVGRLNEFSRRTRSFSPIAIAVREAIAAASEPDGLLFLDLPRACGFAAFDDSRKDEAHDVAAFLRSLQAGLVELQRGYEGLLLTVVAEIQGAFGVPEPEYARAREHLAERAAAVAPIALNADARAFIIRMTDASVNDAIWAEQLAALLAMKHPSLWSDEDRNRFSIRLAHFAEAFTALESLALARRNLRPEQGGAESIRVAIIGTHLRTAEHVIHVDPRETAEVEELERKLRRLLERKGLNGNRRLVLAALARITCALIGTAGGDQVDEMGGTEP